MVLFANTPNTITSTDTGFKGKYGRATMGKARLYCQERGGWVAKNRYKLPEYIPLDWDMLAKHVPAWYVPSDQPTEQVG